MQKQFMGSSYAYQTSKYEKIKEAFNHIIKFLSNFFFVVFVGLILVILIYGVYTKKNGDNGYIPIVSAYVIVSPSMEPTINVHDAVVAYRPNIASLKKNDIITFRSTDARYTGLTVTHRIISIKNEDGQISFKTKGDNNTTPDDNYVVGSNVFGKIFLVIPWLGYLQELLTMSFGWILLVVIPCLAIIIYDIIKLLKTLNKSKVTADIPFKNVEIADNNDDSDSVKEKGTNIKQKELEQVVEIKNKDKEVHKVKANDSSVVVNNKKEEKALTKQERANKQQKAQSIHEEIAKQNLQEETKINQNRTKVIIVANFVRGAVLEVEDENNKENDSNFISMNNRLFEVVIACHYLRDNSIKNDSYDDFDFYNNAMNFDDSEVKEEKKEIDDSEIELL